MVRLIPDREATTSCQLGVPCEDRDGGVGRGDVNVFPLAERGDKFVLLRNDTLPISRWRARCEPRKLQLRGSLATRNVAYADTPHRLPKHLLSLR